MNATNELFDRYKKTLGIASDLGGAKALGVKAQTVSNWRNRGSQASPKLIEAMCKRTGESTPRWLLRVLSEQAPDPADSAVWRRVARNLRVPLAMTGVVLSGSLSALAGAASASATALSSDAMEFLSSSAPGLLAVLQ